MKERLLLVDDEEDILDFLERVFRKDYILYRASSGKEALEIIQREPIDILITDQKMPEMTGLELLAEMRKVLADYDRIIKILLSGYADVPEIVKAVEEYRIHQYMVKPINSKRLRKALEEAKERTSSGDWTLTTGTDPEF